MSGGGKGQVVGYKYFFGIHMGIGHGPVDALHEIQVGGRTAWTGSVSENGDVNIDAPALFGGEDKEGGIQGKLEVMLGGPTQTASAGLLAMLGSPLPGFRRMFTVFFNGIVAMNNPYPKPWKFRFNRTLAGWDGDVWRSDLARILIYKNDQLGQPTINAMNPAHIIYECLTNRRWGRGLSANKLNLDSFEAAAVRLKDEGFGLCIKWTRTDSIQSFVQGVLNHIGANLYQSRIDGKMTLKLLRDDYNLDELPLFDTESGLVEIRDAVVGTKGASVNTVTVTWHDPFLDEPRTVTVKNPGAIQASGGLVNNTSKAYTGIPSGELGTRVAQRDLRAVSTNLRRFTLVADRTLDIVHPGDVIAIRDPKRAIPRMAVRVGKVKDGTLTDGKITLEVVQDVFSMSDQLLAAAVPPTWVPPNNRPCIDEQKVFEVPYFMLARNMGAADLDYVRDDGGYMGFINSRGQPLNVGVRLAVREEAATPDDDPIEGEYFC